MSFRAIFHWLLAFATVLAPIAAKAHTRLKTSDGMIPRSTNPGLKTGPCGNIPRTATPATFTAGQTITVNWEETIDHPGYFELYFSPANDDNWVLLKTVQDTQNTSANMPHQFSTTVALPNQTCDACTFRLIQQMTENPANPVPYFACADIKLVPAGATPTPTPVGTATPTATPVGATPTASPIGATPSPSATPYVPPSCEEHQSPKK